MTGQLNSRRMCSIGEDARKKDIIFATIQNRKRLIKYQGVDGCVVEIKLSSKNIDATSTAGIKISAKYPPEMLTVLPLKALNPLLTVNRTAIRNV